MTSSLRRLEIAIHELAETKHQAELFGWPAETVHRIDVLMRGTAKARADMLERLARHDQNSVGKENDSRVHGNSVA